MIPLSDPQMKALALTAIDAARSAGAHYTDVRLTVTTLSSGSVRLGMSVRALVDGYWGWAATPYLTKSEAPRVGRLAVALAKANAVSGIARTAELAPTPVVHDGTWMTPITIDPFMVAPEEIRDWCEGLRTFTHDLVNSRIGPAGQKIDRSWVGVGANFSKQERLFASSAESMVNQQVYIMTPTIKFPYKGVACTVDLGGAAQAGWEYVVQSPARELVRTKMDEVDKYLLTYGALRQKPVSIGRYDIVCAASAVAMLINVTFGDATQVDRALGYEANAGGTSYLGPDPLAVLGTSVASPLLTITADRSTPKYLATIGWDEEGVAPETFTLLQDGVLVDYQTTREQATWLAPWYAKHGQPVRSHGCADSADAQTIAMQMTPNLLMHPGSEAIGQEEMIQQMDQGYLIEDGGLSRMQMDFQCLNGTVNTSLVEIKKGKPVARVSGAALRFRSPELWKHLMAIGGVSSQQRVVGGSNKGEPSQGTPCSIVTVPALFAKQDIIDPSRKA